MEFFKEALGGRLRYLRLRLFKLKISQKLTKGTKETPSFHRQLLTVKRFHPVHPVKKSASPVRRPLGEGGNFENSPSLRCAMADYRIPLELGRTWNIVFNRNPSRAQLPTAVRSRLPLTN
jgi:hypothetical protein